MGVLDVVNIRERIVCGDGAHVSIQANRYSYCTPRNDSGPYSHIEAGFPSVAPPESWMEYSEEGDNPTHTVYGIPVGHVADNASSKTQSAKPNAGCAGSIPVSPTSRVRTGTLPSRLVG